jgi:phosphatidylinositol alpha 1,6-mannosyltransferase
MSPLRVALFTDSYLEANGVATVSQQFAAYAARQRSPFLYVYGGTRTQITPKDSLTEIELKRGPVSFRLDYDLRCDLLLSRYKNWITEQLRLFRADVVHITGPGDIGVLGFWAAHTLKIPLVASWHTNLHEYAGRRLDRLCTSLPSSWRTGIARKGEALSLDALMRFYRLPKFLMAPNESMIHLLREHTGKPTFHMRHGVNLDAFSATRSGARSGPFRIGYVGRLTPEKNVRQFAELERRLRAAGREDFRLLLVGEGCEKEWLTKNLRSAELPGILRGDALADAFSSMDAFVFPSRTDTFGLVLLEAMASGVPVVVSPEASDRVGVQHRISGFVAPDIESITRSVLELMDDDMLRRDMGREARRFACSQSWSGVFAQVYETYEAGLEQCGLSVPRHVGPALLPATGL